MEITHHRGREGAAEARGLTVVIDVIRAFSVAAYAFAGGASEILLVATVDEAFALKQRFPDALLIGEVGGRLIPGFDLNNSPTRMSQADVQGRRIIQRTGAGTPGVVACHAADEILLGSLVVASATVEYIRRRAPQRVSLVATMPPHYPIGEDEACADYLAALLTGTPPDLPAILAQVSQAAEARPFQDRAEPDFPATDLDLVMAVDGFSFAMPVTRDGDLLRAHRVDIG
jgi:2-phosphosulfolactate phosphatase